MKPHTVDEIHEFADRIRADIEEFSNSEFEEEIVRWAAFSYGTIHDEDIRCMHEVAVELEEMTAAMPANVLHALNLIMVEFCTVSHTANGISRKVDNIRMGDGTVAEIQIAVTNEEEAWIGCGCSCTW